MKHRTITGFIIVVAALTVMPQALQEVSSLKTAAGSRLTAGIWNTILSLQSSKIGSATTPSDKHLLARSADAASDAGPVSDGEQPVSACVQANTVAQKSKAVAPRDGTASRTMKSADFIEIAEMAEAATVMALDAAHDGQFAVALPRTYMGVPGAGRKVEFHTSPEPSANDYHFILKNLGPFHDPKMRKELTRVVLSQNAAKSTKEEARRQRESVRNQEEWQREGSDALPKDAQTEFTF